MQLRFYRFSSANEHEHMRDGSMLVWYFDSAVVSTVISLFVLSRSCLSPLENPPCPENSNHKYPHAFGFPVQRNPLALGIPKSHPWYRLSMPLTVGFFLSVIVESRQQVSPQCISRQDSKIMGCSCQHLLHVSTICISEKGLHCTVKV